MTDENIDFNYNFDFESKEELDKRMREAITVAFKYSQIDGSHHKSWSIDQMVRALLGPHYDAFIETYQEADEAGEPQYSWDEGIAP